MAGKSVQVIASSPWWYDRVLATQFFKKTMAPFLALLDQVEAIDMVACDFEVRVGDAWSKLEYKSVGFIFS